MNFLDVLHELDLPAGPTMPRHWLAFAQAQDITLPAAFQEALSLGAAQLLTQFSNAEEMRFSDTLYDWNSFPVMPLMWENQGNFVFGLHLTGVDDSPVLICFEFKRDAVGGWQPAKWQPFTPDFATFAFARLHDFQYLWNGFDPETCEDTWGKEEKWFWEDEQFTPTLARVLALRFKTGPVTPHYTQPQIQRHRYYRSGQRVTVTSSAHLPNYWEISAASKELFDALHAEIKGLHV